MTGVRAEQFAPIAVVSRSGVDESIHFGALVALNADGTVAFSVGDPNITIFPRSATKPFQALAMVRAGLSLPLEQLALVCSSHNGEEVHQKTALTILAGAGLSENDLVNTPGHPWHAPSARKAIRLGHPKSSLPMDCSGKHAGMLATCALNGWDVNSYLDQEHPLQRAITEVITELTGAAPVAIGTDGCGAPAHVVNLIGLARAARAIAVGEAGDSGNQIFNAMSQYPYMVGGDTRDVTEIVSAIPGLFAKDGAESVYIAAMNDGRAVALKISDGSRRAAPTVLLAALRQLGIDTSGVSADIAEVVYGHGKPVGGVRAIGIGA
jgi:L-asparaginase II